MLHSAFDRALDQRATLHRVVRIIFERVLDRFRHHHRAREMHDRADSMRGDQAGKERLIGNVALDEKRAVRHRPAEAGHQIVDHHHRPARIEQSEHRMAADIAGATGYQHRQLVSSRHFVSDTVGCSKNALKSLLSLYGPAVTGKGREWRDAMKRFTACLGALTGCVLLSACITDVGPTLPSVT